MPLRFVHWRPPESSQIQLGSWRHIGDGSPRVDGGSLSVCSFVGLTLALGVYRACREAEEQIRDQGGRLRRVVLDYELKRECQRFLQAQNRGRADSTGRPDRTPEEIAAWANHHHLPCDGNRVRFPDARIEFEDRDRQEQHRDIEVVTPHYRGAHAAAVGSSGFQTDGGGLTVAANGRRGGRGLDPRLAEEMLG
jgi:hypothetical protein